MGNLDVRDILVWAPMGLVTGAIADLFVPGSGSLIGYMAAGVVGSFVGGFLAQQQHQTRSRQRHCRTNAHLGSGRDRCVGGREDHLLTADGSLTPD